MITTAPPKTQKGRATRERLLACARDIAVANDGHVEIAWVAEGAGVVPSLVNRYFGSRAGLISALLDDFFGRLRAEVFDLNLDDQGTSAVAGLFFVGDALCTTNPASGRGVSLGMLEAAELIRLIGDGDTDYRGAAEVFDAWAGEHVKPWYEDHVYWDATLLARLRGEDIDIDAPLSSDVICAPAQHEPAMFLW